MIARADPSSVAKIFERRQTAPALSPWLFPNIS
jgi:hypothetical protein